MSTNRSNSPESADPHAQLEQEFIREYIRQHLPKKRSLRSLPTEVQHQILCDASSYASSRLAEMETRASLMTEVHGAVKPGQLN